MNICILSNFTKTHLFHAVAQELIHHMHQAYWIATNQKIYDFLIQKYSKEKVLLLNRDHVDKNSPPIADFKLNELVYGDRVLRYDKPKGLSFLNNIQHPIYNFLKKNEIRLVMGEITWAHEVLIHRICSQCSELNCRFLNPHVVRIPDNRFAFFEDERQSKLFEIHNNEQWEGRIIEPKKPAYKAINDKILRKKASLAGRLNRIKRFISNENMEAKDPTLLTDFKWRMRNSVREEWQKETYRRVKKMSFSQLRDTPFVFLGLHKQPEASVDVFGRYYEDQLQNIENLWRALPQGWNLLIKEHSNAIGDRSTGFYKKIKSLPGVFLIDENTNSYEVMKQAKLVVTITGTLGYEAALMGIPSITLAPTFFNQLGLCRQVTLADLDRYNLEEIAEQLKAQDNNLIPFSKYLLSNSFQGNVIDPITDKSVLEPANIKKIAQAIDGVAQQLLSRVEAVF